MGNEIERIETVIEFVIEIRANPLDGSQFVRLTVGDAPHYAMALFGSLRDAHPAYADGTRHDGWMNLIAVTAHSPESTGTLLEQHRWGDDRE